MAEARLQSLLSQAAEMDPLNQVSFLEARTYMGNMLLRDSDQMSMANSIELRVPLVDQNLAAHLLAIPGQTKGFDRVPKMLLRDAYARYLPAEVFSRKKMGFTLPFSVWLRGPLRDQVQGTLKKNPGDLWNPRAVDTIWQGFLSGRVDWSRPWALYVLSEWAARHIGEAVPGDRRTANALALA
jgi:asparagine synthase (glutamine-hydrolysing)